MEMDLLRGVSRNSKGMVQVETVYLLIVLKKTILGEVKKVEGVSNRLINKTRVARMEKQKADDSKTKEG
jgi:hypothetical protein